MLQKNSVETTAQNSPTNQSNDKYFGLTDAKLKAFAENAANELIRPRYIYNAVKRASEIFESCSLDATKKDLVRATIEMLCGFIDKQMFIVDGE